MLRFPLTTLFSHTKTGTASTDATFVLPNYDMNGLVVKLYAPTFSVGTSGNMSVYIQTSDDGGTTFYDCARFTVTATVIAGSASFATIPIDIGDGAYITSPWSGSITTGTVNKLPMLSNVGRIHYVATGMGSTHVITTITTIYAAGQGRM